MAPPSIIDTGSNDRPIRGRGDTATRIYYQSPPPRAAITNDNDGDGLSSRKLVYEDRGVTGILHSASYPKSHTLSLLSKKAATESVRRYEPRHTPPDSFEAQDLALRKAEILRQQTKHAKKSAKHVKVAKPSRRDSAVSEDDELEPQTVLNAAKPQNDLATIDRQEQTALPTIELQDDLAPAIPIFTNTEPEITITSTEPLSQREHGDRASPKRVKLSPSPGLSSPAQPPQARRSKSRAGSENRFAKPKTPSTATAAARATRGESVASARSTDSKSSRRSRGTIKDDLTIDSKFGLDADDPNEVEYLYDGKWYDHVGQGPPDWAQGERPRRRVVAQAPSRRSTGGWRAARN